MNFHQNYFDSINNGLNNAKYFKDNIKVKPDNFYKSISEILKNLKHNNNKCFFFGNGASAAFANHMSLDFSKNGNILSRSLSDSAMLTALSNDYSYEDAMKEFLKIEKIKKEDFVITISSSGNSQNIVNVLKFCRENKIKTLSLSGLKENNISISLSNFSIYVPMKTYGMVECIHQILLHLILDESMGVFEWNRDDYQNMSSKDFKL